MFKPDKINKINVMRYLFIGILAFWAIKLFAGDNVQFTASAPRVVEVGEQFEIVYTITAQPSGLRPPEFKGLNLLGGPSTSSSSSIQIANGKMVQSSSFSYTYFFTANNPGTFTFEPAKATVDGKNYLSNSISIEVVGSARKQQQTNQGNGGGTQGQSGQNVVAEAGNDDLFLRIIVDKNTLYQGDYLIATYKIFTRYEISNNKIDDLPFGNGFYKQDINIPQPRLAPENIGGKVYYTAVINKVVLFPQKSGTLTIEPFSGQFTILLPTRSRGRNIFDDFFGPNYQEVPKKVRSNAVQINVKPLPANAPASFNGAVGNFTFKASVDKNNVKSNDAITYKVVINGSGNLKMTEIPQIKFPADFETFDPKITTNAKSSVNGVNGNKVYEYLIIPRHAGKFKIPSVDFTYFDIDSKQYKTISSGEFEINVEKGANEDNGPVVSGISKEDVKFLGKDILYIKTKHKGFSKANSFLIDKNYFVFLYIIPLLLFIFLIVLWRKKIKENANAQLVRNKKANKVAIKRLKDAHVFMKDNNRQGFYEYILKALWGYMGDKLNIPVAELSREKTLEITSARGIDKELVDKFISIADLCEFARYAPASDAGELTIVYNDAIDLISKMEQKIKK